MYCKEVIKHFFVVVVVVVVASEIDTKMWAKKITQNFAKVQKPQCKFKTDNARNSFIFWGTLCTIEHILVKL